jgi:K+-sensing histidine kinase KdpD
MEWKGQDTATALGLVVAVLGPLAVAGVLVPFRDDINTTNVALVFVVVVVVAAAFGGRWVGATAAVVCTMSYDFFFTRPYQSLTIDQADDIETTVLLLAVGLIVGEIVVLANRARIARDRGRDEIASLHRISAAVAMGAPPAQVQAAVESELRALLSLRGCEFERAPYDHLLPSLERSGSVETTVHRYVGGDFALPAGGLAIPVFVRGVEVGRLVLEPRPDVGVSLEERIVAVALADQLGAAIGADDNHTNNGANV